LVAGCARRKRAGACFQQKSRPRGRLFAWCMAKKSLANATARKAGGWLAKTTCGTVAGPGSSHDETCRLLGQDQLSKCCLAQPISHVAMADLDLGQAVEERVAGKLAAQRGASNRRAGRQGRTDRPHRRGMRHGVWASHRVRPTLRRSAPWRRRHPTPPRHFARRHGRRFAVRSRCSCHSRWRPAIRLVAPRSWRNPGELRGQCLGQRRDGKRKQSWWLAGELSMRLM